MKILMASDYHHYSTKHIYEGYVEAFKTLKTPMEFVDLRAFVTPRMGMVYTEQHAWEMFLSMWLRRDKGFTHGLFLSGMSVPDWVFSSKYDKKIGVIALDDPHASLKTLKNKGWIDYYFSNEKTLEDTANRMHYVPTATDIGGIPKEKRSDLEEKYLSDICFVGNLYPDRVKILEEIAKICENKGLKFNLIGPQSHRIPKGSILLKYNKSAIIDNEESKMYYRGAKISVNIDRDVTYSDGNLKFNPALIRREEPAYSMNPRAYEIASSRSLQLFVNSRQEAKDIFDDNAYYADASTVGSVIEEMLGIDDSSRNAKVKNAFDVVVGNHTYINRALKILDVMKEK